MFVTCLNELEKDDVVDRYVNQEQSQSDIAAAYMLSRRTIQRVLQERGIISGVEKIICTPADKHMLAICQKHGIQDAPTLNDVLSRPVFNHGTVLNYLVKLDQDVLDAMMRAVATVRVRAQPEAANG